MYHLILNLGSALLALTAIFMVRSFKKLTADAIHSGSPVLGYRFNYAYEALSKLEFLRKIWVTKSFEQYGPPLKESLIKARFWLRFQVMGIAVWIILLLITG